MKLLNRFLKWKPVTGGSAERVITFGYFTALLVSVIAIYMTANHVAQWLLFNADSLWTENYLQDWLVKGVDMKTWMTPGAPNFFPEMLIYGLFSFATSSIYWGFVGSGFVKIFFYIFIFYALSSLLTDILRVYKLWFSLFCTSTMSLKVCSSFSGECISSSGNTPMIRSRNPEDNPSPLTPLINSLIRGAILFFK